MTTEKENLLLVLRPKRKLYLYISLIFLLTALYGAFGVVIPVLATGDYNAIWPHTGKMGKNMIGFYLFSVFLLVSPALVLLLKAGHYFFYTDRLEIKPFLGRKKLIVPYKQMHVRFRGNYRMTISMQAVPSWIHPFQRYRVEYWEGLSIALLPNGYENPADIPRAVQILRENAFEFIPN